MSDETVRASMGGGGSIAEAGDYGSVALYIGGTGEVRYKDVAWKDLIALTQPKEQLSNRFTAATHQRLLLRLVGCRVRHQS